MSNRPHFRIASSTQACEAPQEPMISLIPSPTLHIHLAKGHPGAKTAHPALRNSVCGPHFCSMEISEDVRQYAAEQAISEEEAPEKGMKEKSKEFAEAGAEVYMKA